FGGALLDFLYDTRWEELGALGINGESGRKLLRWVAGEQRRSRTVSFEKLNKWAAQNVEKDLEGTLRILFERFLIINSDIKRGRFVVFPSFVEFLQIHRLLEDGP